jgi:response regulator RpfG family c-di-GMP phosphodiesterase
MNISDRSLFLYVDEDQMANVCLEALLGNSFQILAVGEGDSGVRLLEESALDWVIVDFDLPDDNAAEFIKSSGKLDHHGFIVLSGLTTGIIAWEKFHGLSERDKFIKPMNAEMFLSIFSGKASASAAKGNA